MALAIGGALGANARYWVGLLVSRHAGTAWPWSTFVINLTGSLVIGALAGLLARWHPHSGLRLLAIVGFLGSYTTFATFSLDALVLAQQGRWTSLLAYQVGSVAACFLAVWLGLGASLALTTPSSALSTPDTPAAVEVPEPGTP